ncbi:MAG: hypothetical protein ACLP0J_29260 [Solirubrobacteraceae bacterium]
MRRVHLISSFVLAAAILALAADAAYSQAPATQDCNAHGRLIHHYTVAELRKALATMSQTTIEYSNCFQVIDDQLNAQLGSKRSKSDATSSASGSFLSTPVLIVLIVIVLAGGGFALSARRRRPGGDGDGGTPPPDVSS